MHDDATGKDEPAAGEQANGGRGDGRAAVVALVLAGGAGTRFWPASRALRPKQLLPLVSAEPLLVQTVRRVLPLCGARAATAGAERTGEDAALRNVLIATGAHLRDATAAVLPELPPENLLVEPVPRNTAPCIGWAAARVARSDPDAVLMVLPSDHFVKDLPGFRAVLERAIDSAASGTITTVGIEPTHAETGYGYIEVAEAEAAGARGRPLRVRRFVEKPDRARAEAFVASGVHYWNAGMFFFRARDMLAAVSAHMPALAEGLRALDRAAERGGAEEAAEADRVFPTLPAVSIDYGVMEHLETMAMVPGDFGWSDLGSWRSAWELADKDAQGNAAPPGAVLVEARNNHIVDLRSPAASSASKRVVALLGVDDLVVVETDDALLVVPRERSQEVRAIVDALRSRGDEGSV